MIHSSVAEAEGGCATREDRGAGDGASEVEIRQRSPGRWGRGRGCGCSRPVSDGADGSLHGQGGP